jgi:membrane dipeptidase
MKILQLLCLSLFATRAFAQSGQPLSDQQAAVIVARVLKSAPVIDGHNDLFVRYMDCKTCPLDLNEFRIDSVNTGHTDIPRMRKGGAGALLMNVFGKDKSLASYLMAWDLLYRMESMYADDIKITLSSAEMSKAMTAGKIAFLPTLEGATRLEGNPTLLRTFYKLGLRSVTMAYRSNELADGSDDTARNNGLSVAGKQIVNEMNRLGMLIDLSHISEKSMHDILDVSKAPVIFSHSNAKALCNVNRNVSDSVLMRLKQNGGIIMLTFVPYFTAKKHNDWLDATDTAYSRTIAAFPDNKDSLYAIMEKWEKDNPEPVVTVADLADHFDHVKKLIGVDHIGIAGDFDGIQFTIRGLENTSKYPNLLLELARRGWTEAQLKKVTSQNFLRVFKKVEDFAE